MSVRGRQRYETRRPGSARGPLYGLLFTVVVLFALQGDTITSGPLTVARIAPRLGDFAIMWFGGFANLPLAAPDLPPHPALAFSAASNDFELAIAVAIGVFSSASGQALAGRAGNDRRRRGPPSFPASHLRAAWPQRRPALRNPPAAAPTGSPPTP